MICTTRKPATLHPDQTPPYEPTPEEIREVCAEIQRGWTEAERRRRTVYRAKRRTGRHVLAVGRRLAVTDSWDASAVDLLDVA